MVDLLTASTIIGILSKSLGLVDKVTDTYLKFRGKHSPIGKEHRAKIVASEDGASLVRLEHGHEVQRVTYEELSKKLNESDLSYIRSLETSMNTHKYIWESAYPSLASEVNPVAKAKIQQQLDGVASEMENDLKRILEFVEKTGLYLDDHYSAVRDIAAHINRPDLTGDTVTN